MDYRRHRLEDRIVSQVALALTVIALALVQTTLLPAPFHTPMNLLLVSMVCWTVVDGGGQGALIGFYGGLALDLLAASFLGTHILALLLVVWLSVVVLERLPAENWAVSLVLVALLTPVYHLAVTLIEGGAGAWMAWARVVIPPAVTMNLLLTFPVLLVVRWRSERRQRQVR